jgi:hypothetical protein
MISHRDGAREHVDWANLNLKTGDTVTLTVVKTGQVDEPGHRRKTEGPTIEQAERRHLELLQRKYGSQAPRSPSNEASQGTGRRRTRR